MRFIRATLLVFAFVLVVCVASHAFMSSQTGVVTVDPNSLNSVNIGTTLDSQAGDPLSTVGQMTFGATASLWSFTVAGGTLGPWDVMKCHINGDVMNNTGGSQAVTFFFYANSSATKPIGATVSVATSPTLIHPWVQDVTFINQGSRSINSMDSDLWYVAASASLTGVGAAANVFGANYFENNANTANAMTVQERVIIGAATSGATPTAAPTSATTPFVRLYGAHCWKLPFGQTPTPTPTPTQTPAPT